MHVLLSSGMSRVTLSIAVLSLFAGGVTAQSGSFGGIASGTVSIFDEVLPDWEGHRLCFSRQSGNQWLGVLGMLGSAPVFQMMEITSDGPSKEHTYKELRQYCKENKDDRFGSFTFAGPKEIVAYYCGALYLIDAETLEMKKRLIETRQFAMRWSEAAKTLVVLGDRTLTVLDGRTWDQTATWTIPEIRDMALSRDGTLIVFRLVKSPCKFTVRSVPAGEEKSEFSIGNCDSTLQLLSTGTGKTVASLQKTSQGAVLSLWDLATSEKISEVTLQDSSDIVIEENLIEVLQHAAVSPDWKWIAGNRRGYPHELTAWDPSTGRIFYRSMPDTRRFPKSTLPRPTLESDTYLLASGDGSSVYLDTHWFRIGSVFTVLRYDEHGQSMSISSDKSNALAGGGSQITGNVSYYASIEIGYQPDGGSMIWLMKESVKASEIRVGADHQLVGRNGAYIVVANSNADARGNFQLSSLEAGEYTLVIQSAHKKGPGTVQAVIAFPISLRPGQVVQKNCDFGPDGG